MVTKAWFEAAIDRLPNPGDVRAAVYLKHFFTW